MMRCDECKFWEGIGSENGDPDIQAGLCHRHPPRLLDSTRGCSGSMTITAWQHPTVVDADWCGEFQPKSP